MHAQVDQSFTGTLQHHTYPKLVDVYLHWDSADPATICITLHDGQEFVAWDVSRDVLIGAGTKACENAWVGGGDFSVMITGHGKCAMMFRPHDRPSRCCVVLHGHGVPRFIADTVRLCPPGPAEEPALTAQVDRALAELLK